MAGATVTMISNAATRCCATRVRDMHRQGP